jgi:hypothetical protein
MVVIVSTAVLVVAAGLTYYAPGGLGNTPSYSPTQGYDGGTSTSEIAAV